MIYGVKAGLIKPQYLNNHKLALYSWKSQQQFLYFKLADISKTLISQIFRSINVFS